MGKGIVKLGEGQWAVKDGNLLSAKETNGRFKNTEFTVSRGTRASYVGRDGLIKESNLQDVNLVNNGDFSELSSELVTNGTFDTDSDWGKSGGATISGGTGNIIGDGSSFTSLIKADVFTVGKTYKVTVDVTINSGLGLKFQDGSTNENFGFATTSGSYTFYGTANNADFVIGRRTGGTAFDSTVDNVSVKEVDPNDYWTKGTGWSISNGSASYDGLNGTQQIFSNTGYSAIIGKTYKITFDVLNQGNGNNTASFGGVVFSNTNLSIGSYVFYVTATNTGRFGIFGRDGDVFSIDNIVVNEVKTDTPRIDFTDNTDGHLLLEPQSTNLLTYSEDFSNSYWNPNDTNVESNVATSPDGTTNASKITITDVTPYLGNLNISLIVGNTYTISCFVKKGTNRWVRLASVSSNSTGAWFDLDNGVVGTVNSTSATIEDYGNGWYRITNTLTAVNGSNDVFLGLSGVDGSTSGADVIGNDVFVWGFQVEELSYPTSYIPTNGSTVTRDADTCTGAGSSADFNSEEGVLYAEIAALVDDSSAREITLSDGTADNRIELRYGAASNRIQLVVRSGGVVQASLTNSTNNILNFNKVAVKWKANDFALWINGVEQGADTSGSTPVGLNELQFNEGDGAGGEFLGKCKSVRVYKEALSDTDLQNLTS